MCVFNNHGDRNWQFVWLVAIVIVPHIIVTSPITNPNSACGNMVSSTRLNCVRSLFECVGVCVDRSDRWLDPVCSRNERSKNGKPQKMRARDKQYWIDTGKHVSSLCWSCRWRHSNLMSRTRTIIFIAHQTRNPHFVLRLIHIQMVIDARGECTVHDRITIQHDIIVITWIVGANAPSVTVFWVVVSGIASISTATSAAQLFQFKCY